MPNWIRDNRWPQEPEPTAAPAAPRVRRPQRTPLYFSEPLSEHPQYGSGCITYPVEMVVDPNTSTGPVVCILDKPTPPQDMPAGELQTDPNQPPRLIQAGYHCSAMIVTAMDDYWAAARGRPVKGHFHPHARLVQY